MKLNNKGYMLVEIVVAGVLAIGIGYYLLELTFNFSDKNDDLYQSMSMLSDKTVITKSIMSDLEGKVITDISSDNSSYVSFKVDGDERRLEINKSTKEIRYGKYNGGYDTGDVSYYYKKLSNSVIIGDIIINRGNITYINIPLSTIYDDTDYGVKLIVNSEVGVNRVNIVYNANGGTIMESTVDDFGMTNYWNLDSEGNVLKRVDGEYTKYFFSMNYGKDVSEVNGTHALLDYNNGKAIHISKEGYTAKTDEEWCTKKDGTGTCYNQYTLYNASDFCDASLGDCVVTLYVNWQ